MASKSMKEGRGGREERVEMEEKCGKSKMIVSQCWRSCDLSIDLVLVPLLPVIYLSVFLDI
jgi:hypothetical protein